VRAAAFLMLTAGRGNHQPWVWRQGCGEDFARPLPRGGGAGWSGCQRCVQNAPLSHQSERRDVRRADFTCCLLTIDWAWSIEETCARLQPIL
jgi:hypothetical protein